MLKKMKMIELASGETVIITEMFYTHMHENSS